MKYMRRVTNQCQIIIGEMNIPFVIENKHCDNDIEYFLATFRYHDQAFNVDVKVHDDYVSIKMGDTYQPLSGRNLFAYLFTEAIDEP